MAICVCTAKEHVSDHLHALHCQLILTRRQQLTLQEGVNSSWKQHATWECKAGVRDDTKNATAVEITSRRLVRAVSKVDVGAHLSEQEAVTDAFSNSEANTQEIERVKIGSTKFCIRKDPAKEKMVFSKEFSRAVFERGNVELIELKKSSIQCPSCLHYVLEGTLICKCGKLMKRDQDVMNQNKEAFEILKAPYYRTSQIATRGSERGPKPWQQHHHKARDALRCATKGERALTSIWDRWQNGEIYTKSQFPQNWSDAWVRYLDHIVHFNIYHNATQPQRERCVNLLHLRSVDENKQAPPLWQRPGFREAKKELSNLQKSEKEKKKFLNSKLATGSACRTKLTLHHKSTWNG